MLTSLRLSNVTVFEEQVFSFSPGLNVIVGENGTGKTHLLKAAYALLSAAAAGKGKPDQPTKDYLQRAVAQKLIGVFKPDELGRLASRRRGRQRAQMVVAFEDARYDAAYAFSTASRDKVEVEKAPEAWLPSFPVFLPPRELLSLYPGFVALYEGSHVPFEETWRDTSLLLAAPLSKGPREQRVKPLLEPLEEAMGGTISLDNKGAFYLNTSAGSFEMHLVAEGFRKLAMLARLIANGSLLDRGHLFWDEPEANMNPRLLRGLASTMSGLARAGVQVFVTTHSLFLLRELQILHEGARPGASSQEAVRVSYTGLHRGDAESGRVRVEQSPSAEGIGDIAALDEDLEQSERYLNTV